MADSRTRTLKAVGITLACLTIGARLYSAIIPWGASPVPYVCASVPGPTLYSPDRTRRIDVVFNDAGAAHSGNHWTWFVEDHWLLGGVVVAEGYLGTEVVVSADPVPLSWETDGEISIEFCASRYGR
jgi:hypothetical protein